ncbi:MAG: AMP-binding protein [Thermodesulfobacteriota bacterium]
MHTLSQRLSQAAARWPEREALRLRGQDGVQTLTFAALQDRVLRVAGWLAAQGAGPGVRVGLCAANGPHWPAAYFGILACGAVAVPMDVASPAEDLEHFLETTTCRVVFTSAPDAFAPAAGRGLLDRLVVWAADPPAGAVSMAEVLAHAPGRDLPRAGPGDAASIIFTSGTTGRPKGVVLTHANFLANSDAAASLRVIDGQDVFLSLLPLHHAYPFMVNLLTPLLLGCRIVYLDTLKPEQVLASTRADGVTILTLTPQVLGLLARRIQDRLRGLPLGMGRLLGAGLGLGSAVARRAGVNPASPLQVLVRRGLGPRFRFFACGGARLDPEVAAALFELGLPVMEGYGLTETAPLLTLNLPWEFRLGSAGKPLPGVDLRIERPEADESGLAWGQVLARGPNLMAGYFANPEATAAAVRDGWLHTGDLGRLDADGFLHLKGRSQDILVLASGKKVPAEDVERHYAAAPGVREIAVLAEPGRESLAALVVPDPEWFAADGGTDVQGEIRWQLEKLSASLPPAQRVHALALTTRDLPRTRLGKLKRHQVASLFAERRAAQRAGASAEPPAGLSAAGRAVLAVAERVTGIARPALSAHLEFDLGLDSLGRIELLSGLEQALGLSIPEPEFLAPATLAEVAALVEERLGAGAGSPAAAREGAPEEAQEAGAGAEDAGDLGLLLSGPPPPGLEQELAPLPVWARVARAALAGVGLVLAKAFWRLESQGGEGVPDGPVLVCPNHASFLDGPMLALAAPARLRRRLFFIGAARLFERPLLARLRRVLRVLSLSSSQNIAATLRGCAGVLAAGQALCVFPEGARSVDNRLREFKKGPVALAQECGAPVVPVYISGAHAAWGLLMRLPRPGRVAVRFGRPRTAAELAALGRTLDPAADPLQAAALGLREEVARLGREMGENP